LLKIFFTFVPVFLLKKMEDSNIQHIVYTRNVVEFVTVSNEYCGTMEKVGHHSALENMQKLQKILPLLYLKATLLPRVENVLDEELEKYVTELDYNVLHQKWLQLLGENDSFYEVFDPSIQFGQETVTASISESLLDIYQDIKDFLIAYSLGNEDVMNDSLFDCLYRFEDSWGQRLVNVLRAVHMLVYSGIDFTEKDEKNEIKPGTGNPKWLDNFWGTESDEDE